MHEGFGALFKLQKYSLRTKMVTSLTVVMAMLVFVLIVVHYVRERDALATQVEFMSLQLGELMSGSLRHAMLTSDSEMIHQIINDVSQIPDVEQVQILGYNHQVLRPSSQAEVDILAQGNLQADVECRICHGSTASSEPHAARILTEQNRVRLITPISNGSECFDCHAPEIDLLGVILIDASLESIEAHALSDFGTDLLVSALLISAAVAVTYLLFEIV